MIIYPAIDIKNKRCVRLKQGDFNQLSQYQVDPIDAAKMYQDAGAEWLHVIDLDGAQKGDNSNQDVILNMKRSTSLKLQVGGGIRSKAKITELLELGIDRVIVGTYAIDSFDELIELAQTYPNRIIVSLDSKDGFLTTHGWQMKTKIKTVDYIKQLSRTQIDTVVVTDIAKDGMMEGPNFNQLKAINASTSMKIIASGGVSSIKDVQKLNQMNIYGAIIGKALYINQINLKEAIRCSQEELSHA